MTCAEKMSQLETENCPSALLLLLIATLSSIL